jgi:hypothetical protein
MDQDGWTQNEDGIVGSMLAAMSAQGKTISENDEAECREIYRWGATTATMIELDPHAAVEMHRLDCARRARYAALLLFFAAHGDGKGVLGELSDDDLLQLSEILQDDSIADVLAVGSLTSTSSHGHRQSDPW